jgi:hypothetical protein
MDVVPAARASGVVVIVASFLAFGNSISTTPACDWSTETQRTCSTLLANGTMEPFDGTLTTLEVCAFVMGQGHQTGLYANPYLDNHCVKESCKPTECLQTTSDCSDDSDSEPTYSCVPGKTAQDIRPLAPFVYGAFFVLGILMAVLTGRVCEASFALLLALSLCATGTWLAERSVTILASCDRSLDTESCSDSAGDGPSESVSVSLNFIHPSNTAEMIAFLLGNQPSPFATNQRNGDSAIMIGCPVLGCLKTTTTCTTENPHGGPPSTRAFECVDGMATSDAAPVNFFFGLLLVLIGLVFVGVHVAGRIRARKDAGPSYSMVSINDRDE